MIFVRLSIIFVSGTAMEAGNGYVSQSIHQGAEREGRAVDRRGHAVLQAHAVARQDHVALPGHVFARRDQGNLVLPTEALSNLRRDGLGSPVFKAPHHSTCFFKTFAK